MISENEQVKKQASKKPVFIILSIILLILSISVFFFWVTPVTDQFNYEYGQRPSEDIRDYLKGYSFPLGLAFVDLEGIDEDTVPGDYQVQVNYLIFTFDFNVSIRDTVAPKLCLKDENFVFEALKEYDTDVYVSEISDVCPDVSLRYINLSNDQSVEISENKIKFNECGTYEIGLCATDLYGNSSTEFMGVTVDTAPFVTGATTLYLAEGAPIPEVAVTAYDDMDGDLTDNVTMSISDEYKTSSGIYDITYEVTDSLGLTGSDTARCYVYDPLILQDMFNTGRIPVEDKYVSGLINPYDAGYITVQNVEEALNNTKPAICQVYIDRKNGYTRGSGFILKIDSDSIVICTNNHVVTDYKNVSIYFFDTYKARGKVVANSTSPDMALITVDTASIPESTLNKLKTVHINLSYYRELSQSPAFEVGMFSMNSDGSTFSEQYGQIQNKSGTLAEYFKDYAYPVTEVSVDLKPGVSGSCIVDAHGNLICMASFYWLHGGVKENYGVSLDDILDFYEKTFDERLEYY